MFWMKALRKIVSNMFLVIILIGGIYFLPQTTFFKEQVKDLKKLGISISVWGAEDNYQERQLVSNKRFD